MQIKFSFHHHHYTDVTTPLLQRIICRPLYTKVEVHFTLGSWLVHGMKIVERTRLFLMLKHSTGKWMTPTTMTWDDIIPAYLKIFTFLNYKLSFFTEKEIISCNVVQIFKKRCKVLSKWGKLMWRHVINSILSMRYKKQIRLCTRCHH